MSTASICADLWTAQRGGGAHLQRRARTRLTALVTRARTASPFLRHLYRDLPMDLRRLSDLPSVTKPVLMADFDDWVTDPRITRRRIEQFVADPRRAGEPLDDGVFVCTSSGTTGQPGLFVHDQRATDVYWALPLVRGFGTWFSPAELARFVARGRREAQVIGVGAHFAGAAWAQRARLSRAGARKSLAVFGVDEPLRELCAGIQRFDPAVLAGYPSAIDMLAREQLAGRLSLDVMLVGTSGENLDPGVRDRLQAAFGCKVRDTYGTSETVFMAFGCSQNWLHLSSDWFILEPVEADGAPTPNGQYSATALVTNLANHLQPIIRYDIGDSVLLSPDACPCGNPLPAFRVAGRDADVLILRTGDGHPVTVLPLLLGTVADSTAGTCRTQVLQVGPSALRVRGEVLADHDPPTVWRELGEKLRVVLDGQGLSNVSIEVAPDEPEYVTASGKFRRVVPSSAVR